MTTLPGGLLHHYAALDLSASETSMFSVSTIRLVSSLR